MTRAHIRSYAVVTEAVIAAEMERCRATSERDWGALDLILHETLTHTHMNGRLDSKAALMKNVKNRPRTLRRGSLSVRIFGDTAVVTGPQYLNLGEGEICNQVTETWINEDGRWVLVAFHASKEETREK
jgi:hypothetical protein